MKRRSQNRPLKKRVLILCEGESEQIYLNGLKSDYYNRSNLSGLHIEILTPNNTPIGLVKEAKKRIRQENSKYPFHSVWVVFDKDSHPEIPRAFDIAENSKTKINVAFSNICFEYWVLLHFEQTNRAYQNCDTIISYLKRYNHIDYSKTKNNYDLLRDQLNNALVNAEWLRQRNQFDIESGIHPCELNAYTDFDKLFIFLRDLSK